MTSEILEILRRALSDVYADEQLRAAAEVAGDNLVRAVQHLIDIRMRELTEKLTATAAN